MFNLERHGAVVSTYNRWMPSWQERVPIAQFWLVSGTDLYTIDIYKQNFMFYNQAVAHCHKPVKTLPFVSHMFMSWFYVDRYSDIASNGSNLNSVPLISKSALIHILFS